MEAMPPLDVPPARVAGPDVMNDPVFETNKGDDSVPADGDTCRICRSEGSPDEPLFYPCKCSGSIKFVHQDCLMEWLSHSNKKYCELCKTPFRFTKLYHSHMPHTLPMAIFLRKACIHTVRYVLTWIRAVVVAAVWLAILPWCIRWSWRGLFWFQDARWARDAWLANMETLALQAASESDSAPAALGQALSTSSDHTSAEPITLNLSKFIVGALLNPWRPHAPPQSSALANMTSRAHTAAQSTLLSNVQAVNSLTASPWMNRFILDILEGQIVTFLVVIAFILVFLIREWVVQQQPIINAAANAREDELQGDAADQAAHNLGQQRDPPNPAPEQNPPQQNLPREEVMVPGVPNQDLNDALADARAHADQEQQFIGWEAMAALFARPRARHEPGGSENGSYNHEIRRALVQALQEIRRALDTGFPPDDVEKMINLILSELPYEEAEMWVDLLSDSDVLETVIPAHARDGFPTPSLNNSQAGASATGHTVDDEQEEQDSDEEALRRPLMPPRGTSPTPHQVLRAIEESSDELEAFGKHPAADPGSAESDGSWESVTASPKPEPIANSVPLRPSSSAMGNLPKRDGRNKASPQENTFNHSSLGPVGDERSRYDTNPQEDGRNPELDIPTLPNERDIEHREEASTGREAQDAGSSMLESDETDDLARDRHTHTFLDNAASVVGSENQSSEQDGLDSTLAPDPSAGSSAQEGGQTAPHTENDLPPENQKPFVLRLLDWFWADIVPDNADADPLPAPDDEALVRDEADEAPFVHVHGAELDEAQLDQAAGQDPEVLQAAAEAGLDADAMDDVEDLEGILELIGMQGPLVGLLQTAMFCGVLVTTALWAAIGIPYLCGKIALLFLGDPLRVLVINPMRMISFTADAIVDGTIYLGAAATYLGVESLKTLASVVRGTETNAFAWLASRSNSAFDSAGARLAESFSRGEPVENAFLKGSVLAHQSLRTIQSDVGNALAFFTRCILFVNHHLQHSTVRSSLHMLASSLWNGLCETKQHYGALKDLIRATLAKTVKAGSLTVTVSKDSQYVDPSLAYWSAGDRCLAVFAGYAFLATIGTMYLLRKEPLFTNPSLQRLERSFADFLKQAGGVLKVILIISIEMLVFPLYCGMLLDCALLPLFQYASLSSRLSYAARSPCMFAFVHWFIGTCYMFHFALFVSMCRRIMRPGVLYFIRDPDDPTFHPVRDVLERNVTTQLRKIAFSALVYGGLVMFCLGGVVSGIDFVFKGVFPIRWATPEPMLEFPIDFLVYNLVAPVAGKILLPSERVESLFGFWLRSCARFLRLSNFLFGEKNAGEEKQTGTAADGQNGNSANDGRYVRAPASDQVRIPKGGRVFLEVTDENERVDGQPDNDNGMHGKQNRNFKKVYIPSWFRARIGLFIAGLWLFAAAIGVGLTIVPMTFGRKLLAVSLPPRVQTNDLYAFTSGLLALGSVLSIVLHGRHGYTMIKEKTCSQSVGALTEAAKAQAMRVARSVYVWGFALIVVPSLFALVLQLYLILPLHTYTSSTLSSSSVTNTTLEMPTNSTLTSIVNNATTLIGKNIPIYNLANYSLDCAPQTSSLQDEWYEVLLNGPGVFVVENLYQDESLLDAANSAFRTIINLEKSNPKGDHFAPHGKNERIWNSFGKHCLEDPISFVKYYSNPWMSRIFEAWLGPQYRITAQTNIVKPGGLAQTSHRDYHLGFQTAEGCARFPKGMQYASQFLTLQGAVAQTDMPLESGPTRFLPFSQTFGQGYMAYRLPGFDRYFLDNWVSLPLKKGDGVFFNPGLHHAAGTNTSDVDRSANLLQISSAFGKPMESIDAIPLVEKCWDEVLKLRREHGESAEVDAIIAAIGEGYPFPTNLDNRPPAPNGMAPSSEQDLMREAVQAGWSTTEIVTELQRMRVDAAA
ncbi:hypothetical protein MBLNU459_g8268t3 [Dothideomycetes sp. NU459]